MSFLLNTKSRNLLLLFMLADFFCMGFGMGVPIFCIALGFPMGWIVARRILIRPIILRTVLRDIIRLSFFTSLFTFIMLAVIWGRLVPWIFDSSHDLANFGIPMILYSAKASFIGWLVLMLILSPVLQFMSTIVGAAVTLSILSPPDSKPKLE